MHWFVTNMVTFAFLVCCKTTGLPPEEWTLAVGVRAYRVNFDALQLRMEFWVNLGHSSISTCSRYSKHLAAKWAPEESIRKNCFFLLQVLYILKMFAHMTFSILFPILTCFSQMVTTVASQYLQLSHIRDQIFHKTSRSVVPNPTVKGTSMYSDMGIEWDVYC